MIELKAKLWRGVGLAALAVGVVGLAACSPGGEGGASGQHGEAGEAATPPPPAPTSAGGESGEAGTNLVYDNLSPTERTQLRLQHLKGFLLIAGKERDAGHAPEAGALIGQGVLEVYTPAAADFAGLDVGAIEKASGLLMDGKPNGGAALQTALSVISAKQGAADAELVRRMLRVTGGLYSGVNGADGVDPIEYQHSQGAALSTLDAFARAEPALRAKNPARASEAKTELARLVALWPSVQAPDTPAPAAQVNAQISRVELALSGL